MPILHIQLSQTGTESESDNKTDSDDDQASSKGPKGAVAKYLVRKAKTPEQVKIILANDKKAEKHRKDRKAAKRKEDSKAAERKKKETAAAKKAKKDEKEIKVRKILNRNCLRICDMYRVTIQLVQNLPLTLI